MVRLSRRLESIGDKEGQRLLGRRVLVNIKRMLVVGEADAVLG